MKSSKSLARLGGHQEELDMLLGPVPVQTAPHGLLHPAPAVRIAWLWTVVEAHKGHNRLTMLSELCTALGMAS